MANATSGKLKMLYILKELLEKSDEDNRLSVDDLKEALKPYGLSIDRKSIYSDIKSLSESGYDILYSRENPSGYYIGSRDFDVAELKLLVDAVQSSKFITQKKSRELIEKLSHLTSTAQGNNLVRHLYVINRVKTVNESIYYNVDRIHDAITNDKQISFTYHKWNLDKELEPKNDGRKYVLSPWAVTWDDENYYLLGYDENADIIKYYRIDKMKSIDVIDKKRKGQDKIEEFDISSFVTRTFNMWGAQSDYVVLRCSNDLVGVIIDRFGTDVDIVPDGDSHFTVKVEASIGDTFFGWVVSLGPGAQIIKPEYVVEKFKEQLNKFL